MFRVFNNFGQFYQFSDKSEGNFETFTNELAKFCHSFSNADASAIVQINTNENGDRSLAWHHGSNGDVESFGHLWPKKLIEQGVSDALQRGIESRLEHCRSTGELGQLTDADGKPTHDHVAANSLAKTPTETIHGDRCSDVAFTTKAETVASVPRDLTNRTPESVVWIRPLSSSHALVSICPKSPLASPLIDLIRNAHEMRNQVQANLKLEQNCQESRKVLRLAESISTRLPLREQAYILANEIRRFLACDRVSVFDVNNSSATAVAVSGQPKFDPRSNTIRMGQSMVGQIAKIGEPFWFSGNYDELADSLKDTVRRYTDESLVNSFVLFPLVETQQPVFPSEDETMLEAISPGSASEEKTVGAVLVEQIEDVLEKPQVEERWKQIHPLVLNQFNNSRKYDSIFLVRLWDMLGRFAALYRGQTKRKAIGVTAAIGFALLAALLIPCDFKIRCEGYLVFEHTLEMYSKGDGNVIELNAFDGKEVSRGDILLVQENIETQKESTRISGVILQKETEIADLNDMRSKLLFSFEADNDEESITLAQKVRQLEVELGELKLQQKLVQREMNNLEIRAPFDGTIAGWKAERRLLGRPLDKGTHLFSLIPTDASFKLELRVPDQRAGYVQNAWHESKESDALLPVVFRLASAPGKNRNAKVTFVSPGLERDEHIGYTLPIHALTNEEIPFAERRSKTSVMAHVVCGRNSFAYCKSYEAIDWLRSKLFEFSL